jgi:hypothetical protein
MRTGTDTIESAVREAGGECRWLSVEDEANGRYGVFPLGASVVFRGSFEAAEAFRSARPQAWPGVIGDAAVLRCSAYYPQVGDHLLNREYALVPLGDLVRLWPALQRMFGFAALFVRPDLGAKAFTGQVVGDLQGFMSRERPYLMAMAPSDLCLVAKPQGLVAEYRMVVVEGTVVAGSRYKLGSQKQTDPDVPEEVLAFAQETVASGVAPDPAFMLDVAVCEGDERLAVVELNAFSSSDFYEADARAIVGAVERLVKSS